MLTFKKTKMKGAKIAESSLPSIAPSINVQDQRVVTLDETDEIYSDLGRLKNLLPFRQQSIYDRELDDMEFDVAVLENDYLRAVFLIGLGGRLWSLYDKKEGRDILYTNDCFRPCNLALRNAWFSGGVEWNIGAIGHSPYTASPLFTAHVTAEDGSDVLRMYEYERIRNVTYQMDFMLPKDSRGLMCFFRIHNLNEKTIPMYWWSNMALPEDKGSRLVVPTEESYYSYLNTISKTSIPMRKGFDASYPVNTQCAMDYFYIIPDKKRTYIAYADDKGNGLLQTSTDRLRGRKLFVWGQSPGSETWQRFLTNKAGNYIELQAGLARTQYECIPMPPKTVWDWVEVYAPLNTSPEEVHGSWARAQANVEKHLDKLIKEDELDNLLVAYRNKTAKKKGKLISKGSGFGALENLRRQMVGEDPISQHLDFGRVTDEQADFTTLLEEGKMPRHDPLAVPQAYVVDENWTRIIEKAATKTDSDNWYTLYHYGMCKLAAGDYEEASSWFEKSISKEQSCWSYYALFVSEFLLGKMKDSIGYLIKGFDLNPTDLSLARELFKFLSMDERYDEIFNKYDELEEELKQDSRIRFYLADAYAKTGDFDSAEQILYSNGGLVIPDIREGESSITQLWIYIQENKETGSDTKKEIEPPAFLDFRMASES